MKKITIITFILSCSFFNKSYSQIPDRDSIMTSIRQRDAGNCVSVAVIQAAISVFGINEVFESKEDNNGIFFIRLKNGDSFTISKEELEIAEATAKIGYDKTFKYVYDYVILCYAVIIKQRIKIDKYSDFKTSSEKVAGGGWTPTSFYYLGLENYAECKGRFASVDGLTGVVAWRGHHAVYVNNHKYFSQKVRNLNLFFTGRYVLHNNEMYEIHKDEVHKIHISRFPYNDFLFEYFEEES